MYHGIVLKRYVNESYITRANVCTDKLGFHWSYADRHDSTPTLDLYNVCKLKLIKSNFAKDLQKGFIKEQLLWPNSNDTYNKMKSHL